MLARTQRSKGQLSMKGIRSDNAHRVNFGQQIRQLGDTVLEAMLLGKCGRPLRDHIEATGQFHPRDTLERSGMCVRHATSSNDPDSDLRHELLRRGKLIVRQSDVHRTPGFQALTTIAGRPPAHR